MTNLCSRVRIGTAGWNLPSNMKAYFPEDESHLQRYCHLFNAVEINTSFYRSHQRKTYERWAAQTPKDFQFAVKVPKEITHKQRLDDIQAPLDQFLDEVGGLDSKLGPLLIQLPPSLKFEQKVVDNFFRLLRDKFKGKIVLEPRHISWSCSEIYIVLAEYNIVRVISDPEIVPAQQSNQQLFKYYRLHGSPKIYESSYEDEYLNQLATQLSDSSWVIFDNTKFSAAIENAISLKNIDRAKL